MDQQNSELVEICDRLKRNDPTLTQVSLYGNKINLKGAESLAEALKLNTTLVHLNFYGNDIESKGTELLAEALKSNTSLTQLNFYDNKIDSKGAESLAEALKSNTNLTQLNLWDNKIDSKGAESLAGALKLNTNLTKLNLSRNQIDSKGAESLAEVLKSNTTLKELDLWGNQIDSKGAESLAEALKSNTTLAKLNLGCNQIDSKGAESLAEALKSNTTLTQLNIGWNEIDFKTKDQIEEILKRNQKLFKLKKKNQGPKAPSKPIEMLETIKPPKPKPWQGAKPKTEITADPPKSLGLIRQDFNPQPTKPTLNPLSSGTTFEIPFSELQIGDELGSGRFGVVRRATYKGKYVAVKLIKGGENDQELYELFCQEMQLISTLDHPNVVKCLGGCIAAQNLCIVTEYCNGGSLYNLLHTQKVELSFHKQLEYALRIAEGMEYLHSHHPMIVHHDLKSHNILLHNGVLKITDYIMSQKRALYPPSLLPYVGTYNWMAPEVMNNEPSTEKVDVWSFGMVLYEITTNTVPYDYCKDNIPHLTIEVIVKKKIPPISNQNQIQPILLNLMKQCWNWDPHQRPSFSEIVQTLRNAKQSQ